MSEVLRKIAAQACNMVARALIDRLDPDGSFAQIQWLSGRVTPEVEVFQPQGVHFAAPNGSEGLAISPGGEADNVVMVSAGDRSKLPLTVLAPGEGGLHFLGAFKVYLAADGTLCLGTQIPTDFVALASKVDANFTSLMSAISGAVPVPNDGGAALQLAITTNTVIVPVGSILVKAQ